MLTKKEYYRRMYNFDELKKFKTIHRQWHECFGYILRQWRCGYTEKSIDSLFYDWEMSNWKALWQENSEFAGKTKSELLEVFCGECFYMCDRPSYDRVFRAHWLFRQVFKRELVKICYERQKTRWK